MSDRDELAKVLADHRSKGSDVRWDRDEIDWIHWWLCSCGYEVRTDKAPALWFETHLARDVLAAYVARERAAALREAAEGLPTLLLNVGAGVHETYVRKVDLFDRADVVGRGEGGEA